MEKINKRDGNSADQTGITFRQLASLYAMQSFIEIDAWSTVEEVAKIAVKQVDALIAELESDGK